MLQADFLSKVVDALIKPKKKYSEVCLFLDDSKGYFVLHCKGVFFKVKLSSEIPDFIPILLNGVDLMDHLKSLKKSPVNFEDLKTLPHDENEDLTQYLSAFKSWEATNNKTIKFKVNTAFLKDFVYFLDQAPKDDVRYYLNSVLLDFNSGWDHLKVVTTNGHYLLKNEYKDVVIENPNELESGRYIVPKEPPLMNLLDLIFKQKLDTNEASIQVSFNTFKLEIGDLSVSFKLIDARYPDIDNILNQIHSYYNTFEIPKDSVMKFIVDAKKLKPLCITVSDDKRFNYEKLRAMLRFNRENANVTIKAEFPYEHNSIKCNNYNAEQFTALIKQLETITQNKVNITDDGTIDLNEVIENSGLCEPLVIDLKSGEYIPNELLCLNRDYLETVIGFFGKESVYITFSHEEIGAKSFFVHNTDKTKLAIVMPIRV